MTYIVKTKPGCPYCTKAKDLLAGTGEIVVEHIYQTAAEIADFKAQGWKTFPQIFHDGKLIGGCDELERYLEELAF